MKIKTGLNRLRFSCWGSFATVKPNNSSTMHNPFESINARLANLEALALEALNISRGHHVLAAEVGGIELAQELTRLSKARIYTLVSERAIPHAKRGNRLFFNRQELLQWVAAGNRAQRSKGISK